MRLTKPTANVRTDLAVGRYPVDLVVPPIASRFREHRNELAGIFQLLNFACGRNPHLGSRNAWTTPRNVVDLGSESARLGSSSTSTRSGSHCSASAKWGTIKEKQCSNLHNRDGRAHVRTSRPHQMGESHRNTASMWRMSPNQRFQGCHGYLTMRKKGSPYS
jgi:hypothetical protein